MVRRQGRRLGARALLARRRHPARLAARRPAAEGAHHALRRHVILSHQRADGWYGPYPEDAVTKRYDMWAILLANKVLAQYHDATGDARVLDAVTRSLRALLGGPRPHAAVRLGQVPLVRGPRAGVPRLRADARSRGCSTWRGSCARRASTSRRCSPPTTSPLPTPRRGLWKWTKHVVNTGDGRRRPRPSAGGSTSARPIGRSPATMIAFLDRHHGQVTGMFTGDECLAGQEPAAGHRTVRGRRVHVLARAPVLGLRRPVLRRPARARRLQRAARHLRARHVVAPVRPAGQPGAVHDQPRSQLDDERSRVEPLRPRAELRLLHVEHAPGLAEVRRAPLDEVARRAGWWPRRGRRAASRRASRGVPVRVDVETDYPFRDTIKVVGRAGGAPVALPAAAARAGVGRRARRCASARGAEEPDEARHAPPGRPRVGRRPDDARRSRFPMRPKATVRYNEAVAVERGPLVYALAIGEEWTRVNADKPHRELPHGDFEVRPTTPWNYGLVARPRPARGRDLRFEERPVGDAAVLAGGRGRERTGAGAATPGLEAGARVGGRGLPGRRGVVGPRAARRGPAEEVRSFRTAARTSGSRSSRGSTPGTPKPDRGDSGGGQGRPPPSPRAALQRRAPRRRPSCAGSSASPAARGGRRASSS